MIIIFCCFLTIASQNRIDTLCFQRISTENDYRIPENSQKKVNKNSSIFNKSTENVILIIQEPLLFPYYFYFKIIEFDNITDTIILISIFSFSH
jgi:hypothetical protein